MPNSADPKVFFPVLGVIVAVMVGYFGWTAYDSNRHAHADTVRAAHAVGDAVVLFETCEHCLGTLRRLVALDAKSGRELAIEPVDGTVLAITDTLAWVKQEDRLDGWSVPDLKRTRPWRELTKATPALRHFAPGSPRVDASLLCVVNGEGAAASISLATGESGPAGARCDGQHASVSPVGHAADDARGSFLQPETYAVPGGSERLVLHLVSQGRLPRQASLVVGAPPSEATRWTTAVPVTELWFILRVGDEVVIAGQGGSAALALDSGAVRWQR